MTPPVFGAPLPDTSDSGDIAECFGPEGHELVRREHKGPTRAVTLPVAAASALTEYVSPAPVRLPLL